jgi:hypothetical protein
MSIKDKYTVERISNLETNKWLLDCHYSHRWYLWKRIF